VIHYRQEREGIHLEVEARKLAWDAAWQRSIGKSSVHFEARSEHGIFHGITV
jgi:hypothetical protein